MNMNETIAEGRRLLDEALPGPWNLELIVWARNNLPALLDTLDRVREEADDLAHSDDGKHSYEFGLSEAGKRILAVLDGGQ